MAPVSSTVMVCVLRKPCQRLFLRPSRESGRNVHGGGGHGGPHEAGAVEAVGRDRGVAEAGARHGADAVVGRAGALLEHAGQGHGGEGEDGNDLHLGGSGRVGERNHSGRRRFGVVVRRKRRQS